LSFIISKPKCCDQLLAGIILFFQISFSSLTSAQTFTISFPANSKIYERSEIPFNAVIAGTSCSNTIIKSRNGKISQVAGCQYLYQSNKPGTDTIDFFIKNGRHLKRIGQQVFDVLERPAPEANLSGLNGGTISKGFLLAQQGISARFFVSGVNHWEFCEIKSFTYIIIRSDSVLLSIQNPGFHFSEKVKAAMKNLEHGDIILISNLEGCLFQENKKIKPLEFTID
jgi:hypothetical protein